MILAITCVHSVVTQAAIFAKTLLGINALALFVGFIEALVPSTIRRHETFSTNIQDNNYDSWIRNEG